ncbi:MAG: putative signal transducing protein [Actinomycetota bacterium]
MFCPSCTDEYREGITHCPECGSVLVSELPDERWALGPELVEVHRTGGHMNGEMIRSLLRGSDIESMLTGEGEAGGQVYRLTAGPMADVRVWVSADEADRARALIEDALGQTPDPEPEYEFEERPRGVLSSFVTNPIVRGAALLLIIVLVVFLIWTST